MSQECYPFVVDTCCRDFPVCQWSLFLDIYIHFSICCLPGGAVVKNLLANAGDSGSIPGSGKRQPTPVFLPRESHGQRSLADYSPQACRVVHSWAHTFPRLCWVSVAARGVFSCSTQDLFSCSMWDLDPDQGLNSGLLHWERTVLALEHQGSPYQSSFDLVYGSFLAMQRILFLYNQITDISSLWMLSDG